MKKNTNFFKGIPALLLVFGTLWFTACPTDSDDNGSGNSDDGIEWGSEVNGTLTIVNNTDKDMVIFSGQIPAASTILGGVRADVSRVFDLADDVDDFDEGGYIILRGMTLEEYTAQKANLSTAKAEYSAIANYGQGQKVYTEINPSYMGDFGYKVTNTGTMGLELRKGSPYGENIAYLPPLAVNVMLYSKTSESFSIFPVYVHYDKSTGQLKRLKQDDQSVTVTPQALDNVSTYRLGLDQNKSLEWPVAYITVSNNVPHQGVFFSLGGMLLSAQNGYDAVSTGGQLTFEVESTASGTEKNMLISLYAGSLQLPVRFSNTTSNPLIKNGYDYTVTVNFNGGEVADAANYTVILVEGSKRVIEQTE